MVDITQFTSVLGLAILVGIIVQLVKPTLKPHLIPYAAILAGVSLALVTGWVLGALTTPAEVFSYVLGGVFAALLAVGGYEASIDKLKLR